ncbi:MAG TPA: mannitol dehydrogenase family protein, partial [Marivita sp.]|nr:mannitol dehydrogenase family protein [Marivita sp.]
APENPRSVLDVMASSTTRIVSLTVTEKGYCRGEGGTLDRDHPDIVHDLTASLPRSAPGFIVRALAERQALGLPPFTVMSLDNLSQNGVLTRRIVLELAEMIDPALAEWIASYGRFPSSMVDRIVPATTPEMIERLRTECAVNDAGAVFHEPFSQWVIEDSFVAGARPDWDAVGAQLVDDVAPFEHMKLRMLNGSHSALAYIGSLKGYHTVSDAVADPAIAAFLHRMWREEIAPGLQSPPGEDLSRYANTLMMRYRNPEIQHSLRQIAMDGSQKLPQRILDPLFENRATGRPYQSLLTVLAAWIVFLKGCTPDKINDPLADDIATALADQSASVARLLDIRPIFGAYLAQDIAADLDELVRTRGLFRPVATR